MTRCFAVLLASYVLTLPVLAQSEKSDRVQAVADRKAGMEMARQIDQLVTAAQREQSISPNPLTSDEQFARRVYLDIAGRIPTYAELTSFLDDRSTNKRLDLIDQLLASDGYNSHMYNYWADVLRVKSRLTNQVGGLPYMQWIRQAIADNMPYDRFVYELLTAEGRVTDNGAAGYFIRDTGMPLDNMANTLRIFLGTRVGCAQCHDHPFDKWTQYQFYEMAAYTFGTQTRQQNGMRPQQEIRKIMRTEELTQREQQVLRRLLVSQSYSVSDTNRKIRLPDDYKYSDAKPKDVVEPYVIFGQAPDPQPGQPARHVFASWLTASDNERFAPVIANRMWARAMGVGLVDPIDDWTDETKPSIPALLDYLSEKMRSQHFDLRSYLRGIYYSKTYQRQAEQTELAAGTHYFFPGPVLRRMTAEQMWDSLMTLTVPDLDERAGVPQMAGRYEMMDDSGQMLDPLEMEPSELVALVRQAANPQRNRQRMMQINRDQPAKYRGLPANFVRASEQQSPAPPGTFLAEFGASDRELLDAAHADPTVTQALEMLNGSITNRIVMTRSALGGAVAQASDDRQKVRILFLSILGREPSASDLKSAMDEIRFDPRNGLASIATALLNTREFMFVQ